MAENSRIRSNKSCTELHDYVQQKEQVREGPKVGDQDGEFGVVGQANAICVCVGKKEKERIDEKSDDSCEKENVVPVSNNVVVRVENLMMP